MKFFVCKKIITYLCIIFNITLHVLNIDTFNRMLIVLDETAHFQLLNSLSFNELPPKTPGVASTSFALMAMVHK